MNCVLSVPGRTKEELCDDKRCMLLLKYRAQCGHFYAPPGSEGSSCGGAVCTEDDVTDPEAYRALQASGCVFVHADSSVTYSCKRLQAHAEGLFPGATSKLSSDGVQAAGGSSQAREDAERFNFR